MNAASAAVRRLARWAMAVLAISATACGGGGSSSTSTDIPVRMSLAASALDAHTVGLEWSGLSGPPTSYSLYIDGVFYRTEYPSGASVTSERSRVGSLAADTRYCFLIYAVYFPTGIASRSNEACIVTPRDAAPAAPSGLSAVATSPARIDLAWNAAVDDWGIAQYRVERDGAPMATVGGASTVFTDVTVIPGTRYCYTVTAVDSGGNASSPSGPACAHTPSDTQSPAAPAFLTLSIEGTLATINWAASSDDSAIAFYRVLRDGALLRDVPSEGGDSIVMTDGGLAVATQYCYEVLAVDRAGNVSAPSPRACGTAGWMFATIAQGIDARDAIGRSSMALDAADRLHIAYRYTPWETSLDAPGASELRYLTNASGAWSDRSLLAPVDATPSIAVAGAAVHIGYRQVRAHYLDLATMASEPVGTETPQDLALAVDAGGRVQMALAGSAVRFAVRSSAGWSVAPVSSVYPIGVSLALDRNGAAHLAFRDASASSVYHASNASGAWVVTPVIQGAAGSYFFPSVATDSGGAVHVAYGDEPNGRVVHATNRPGAWIHTVVDGTRTAGPIAVAVDAADAVHMSYGSSEGSGALKYAHDRDGTWRDFILTQAAAIASVSIGVDGSGRVSIAYSGHAVSALRLATTAP